MTPDIDWSLLAPEVSVGATLVMVFVADLFVSRRAVLAWMAIAGCAAAVACAMVLTPHHHSAATAGGTFVVDDLALVAKMLFAVSTAAVIAMGLPKRWKGEYLSLLLASLLGMMVVVSARDFVLFVVGFELFAIPGYLLTGWQKRSRLGHEGLLKYFLLGVIATAVMIYGLSLLFGLTGDTAFTTFDAFFRSSGSTLALGRLALVFVLVGLLFKIAAVPFHFWAPDAYQSAPIPVAGFLAGITKAAGVYALVVVCLHAAFGASAVWAPVLVFVSIVSMTVGNVVALRQNDLVRLMAYSSVAHAGYVLVPLAVTGHFGGDVLDGVRSITAYLVVYVVTTLLAFAAVAEAERRRGTTSIDGLRGMFAESPFVAIAVSVAMFSLAGIPPFGGWFAKAVVFRSAIESGTEVGVALAVVAAINSAIALAYYAKVVRVLWMSATQSLQAPSRTGMSSRILCGFLVAAVVAIGVFPSLITAVSSWITFVQ